MGVEIERKFLVLDDGWRAASLGALPIRQGYLSRDGALTLRVRLYCDQASLTLKSQEIRLVRAEFAYEIPVTDAENLLAEHCRRPLITKLRHQVRWAGAIGWWTYLKARGQGWCWRRSNWRTLTRTWSSCLGLAAR